MKKLNYLLTILMTAGMIQWSSAQSCADFYWWITSTYTLNGIDTNWCPNGQRNYSTWDFGDSTAQDTGAYVQHTYASFGSYYVTMTVHDSAWNFVDDSTVLITIGGSSSCASFNSAVNVNSVNFNSTSGCVGQNHYVWHFGDGTSYSGSTTSTSHTYNTTGTFTVTLFVYSGSNFLDSVQGTVTINSIPPPVNCASFTHSVSMMTASFQSTSTCSGAAQYVWVFGDGNTGTGMNTSHTYANGGSYPVVLAVLDSGSNLIDSAYQIVNIASCHAMFSRTQALDSNGNPIPGHVVITDQSIGSSLNYFWDFGDGNTSILHSPSHTYTGNGPYNLCLTVSDSGCSSTYCDSLSVDSNGILLKGAPGFTIHVGGYSPGVGIAKNMERAEVKAYPNPFDEVLYLNISGIAEGKAEIRILNEMGQIVVLNYLNIAGDHAQYRLDTRQLEKGIYILQLQTNQGVVNTKLIHQ